MEDETKIKIIAENCKDLQISNQYEKILNWKVVSSKSDMHPDYGYPMGKILFRDIQEAEDYISKSEFTDCFIQDFNNTNS